MKYTETSITVSDIEIHAYHGVLEHERTIGNKFLVSVTLDFDGEAAMLYDDLTLTINYAEVVRLINDVMLVPSLLIENVTYRIIAALKEAFPIVTGGVVSVTKLNPPFPTPCNGATFTASFKA